MPIPFEMIAVMLFLGFYAGRPDPAPYSLDIAALILCGFAAALAIAASLVNLLSLAFIRKRAARYTDRRQAAAMGETAARAFLFLFFAAGLNCSTFPWSLARAAGWDSTDPFPSQMTGLLLYIIFFVCAWLPLFRLHREITPGLWNRRSFLVHKARYSLYMLMAWIPFAIFSEWLSEFLFFLPLAFFLAAWTFPYLLAKLWGCKPLEDGPLRDMVKQLEKQTGTGFSHVLVWEPGGGRMQNAAAVGLFRPFRYLFLTPALMENMNQNEMRGVILHELGHVKKKHLLFYLFTTLAGVNAAILASEVLPLRSDLESFAVMVLLVLAYFRLVFGWMSRTMERQADLFALETVGSAGGLINALEKLGISAGNIRQAHSWHHLGIGERTGFLRRAEADPRLLARHNTKARNIMLCGYTLSILLLVGVGLAVHQEMTGTRRVFTENRSDAVQHWRRVMSLFPGSAVGPLELAYSLAADPDSHGEAIELAAKATRLANDKEEREAAEKLIENLSEGTP